jgi:hypothetical protein
MPPPSSYEGARCVDRSCERGGRQLAVAHLNRSASMCLVCDPRLDDSVHRSEQSFDVHTSHLGHLLFQCSAIRVHTTPNQEQEASTESGQQDQKCSLMSTCR